LLECFLIFFVPKIVAQPKINAPGLKRVRAKVTADDPWSTEVRGRSVSAAIYLVRHATHDEVGVRLSGRSEIGLNAAGMAEAACAHAARFHP
jgi:hypothetical protein